MSKPVKNFASAGSDQQKLKNFKILSVVLAAVVIFLGIVVVAQMGKNSDDSSNTAKTGNQQEHEVDDEQPAQDDNQEALDVANRDENDPLALGPVDAEDVMVHWTDPRCPFCAHFSKDTFPTLVDEYVDTDKIRIEVRPVAFFGEESQQASAAVHVAGEQGKGLEYLDELFERAPESGHQNIDRDKLIDIAETVEIEDMEAFKKGLDDPKYAQQVAEATTEAQQLGVNGVPYFAIRDAGFSGAQPIENFRGYIDSAIN